MAICSVWPLISYKGVHGRVDIDLSDEICLLKIWEQTCIGLKPLLLSSHVRYPRQLVVFETG